MPKAEDDAHPGSHRHLERGRTEVAEDLLESLSGIRRNARRHAARPAELAQLTDAQLELVRLVRRQRGVSVAEAAAALRLAPNTVSTLVRQLTEAGLLVRLTDSTDRRVARLRLAQDISNKVDAWRDRSAIAVSRALGKLSETDRRRVHDAIPALVRLAGALREEEGREGEPG